MIKKKTGLTRIITVCLINFSLNYLLLYPLGLIKYLEAKDLTVFALVGITVSFIPLITTLVFYKLIDKKPLRSLGFQFRKRNLVFSLLSVALTVMMFFGFVLIASGTGLVSAEWNTKVFSQGSFYLYFLLTFASWFIAYEEVLFRGYFVENLKSLSAGKLYVVTSVIFMIFHIFRGLDPINIVILMVNSCVFLFIYLKSGSLLPGTFAHLIFNFTMGHLVGTSDIAILKYSEDLGILNLVIVIVYIILQTLLTKFIYKTKKQPTNNVQQLHL